jgi:hypothetical protein
MPIALPLVSFTPRPSELRYLGNSFTVTWKCLHSKAAMPCGTAHRLRIWSSHSNGHGTFCNLAYNAMMFDENQPMFQSNMLPQSSGSKNKKYEISMKPTVSFVTCKKPKWRLRRNIPPIRRLNFNKLHGAMGQKIELLIATHLFETLRSCIC